MLTKHPMFVGKLVEAWLESAYRIVENQCVHPTRFKFSVDENDEVLAAVSNKYRLVRNADLISAVDVAADERGIVLEPTLAAYSGGRSKYSLAMPSLEFAVERDPSKIRPQIILRNDYRGGGGLVVQSGYFRVICSNGLVAGKIAHYDFQRHVGDFKLDVFVGVAMDRVIEVFEADRIVAETMVNTPIIAGAELLASMLEVTADRYKPDMKRAVRENEQDMGSNAWAYAQAVAEVATHRMQERGRYNMSADVWADRMQSLINEHISN